MSTLILTELFTAKLSMTTLRLSMLILTKPSMSKLVMAQLLVLHDHAGNGGQGKGEETPHWNAVILQGTGSEDYAALVCACLQGLEELLPVYWGLMCPVTMYL